MKFATKHIRHYPTHLKHLATLPWEIENSNFRQIFSRYGKMQTNCICILLTLLFIDKFWYLIFSVSKTVSFFPYWLQIRFSVSLFFYLFTFPINSWQWKFITADVSAVFVNNQHDIQRRGPDFDFKNTYIYSAYSYACRGFNIGARKMQLLCISPYLLNICRNLNF